MIWLEVVLGFVVPVGFGVWQLLDLRRERRLDAAKAAARESIPVVDGRRPDDGAR